jgi:hypothetical protein
MKKKILFSIVIISLVLSLIFISNYFQGGEKEMEEERKYQGPVRPTDDEEYFRKTGITKFLEVAAQ